MPGGYFIEVLFKMFSVLKNLTGMWHNRTCKEGAQQREDPAANAWKGFSILFCGLLFPAKIFHSFCLALPEVLWAELSLDSYITSETAWTILDDLPIFLSFNYMSSSVHGTPESTSPTSCAPSCWQIPCLLILLSQDRMSKILLKSRWRDSCCFSCII